MMKKIKDIRTMIDGYIHSGSLILISVPFRRISAKFVALLDEYVLMRQIRSAIETDILLLKLGATDFL